MTITWRGAIAVSRSVDEPSYPPEIVEVPPDHERLADDIHLGDESPVAAVAAAVAVVAHHKVASRRNLARKAGVIVDAILLQGKLLDAGRMHARCIGLDEDRVLVNIERLDQPLRRNEREA